MANEVKDLEIKLLTKTETEEIMEPVVLNSQAVIANLKNVLLTSFFMASHKFGGLYLQITQRFLTVQTSNIKDLMSVFTEIKNQMIVKENYVHTVNVMCINSNAKANGNKVISIFDGQHRAIFFSFVMLSLLKMIYSVKTPNETLEIIKKQLIMLLFRSGVINFETFFINYVDRDNSNNLKLFLEDFSDFIDNPSKKVFTSYVEKNKNAFSESFSLIHGEVKTFIETQFSPEFSVEDSITTFYKMLTNRVSIIVRNLLPHENETIIFIDINKSSAPFFEYEVIKMLTTAAVYGENQKYDYAQKFNQLVNWVTTKADARLSESELAHVLRFVVLKMTKYTKSHISITLKSDPSKKLSNIVKTELLPLFNQENEENSLKKHEEFLKLFKEYLIIYLTLKEGKITFPATESIRICSQTTNIIDIYSFVFKKAGNSGQRFSYLVMGVMHKLIFGNADQYFLPSFDDENDTLVEDSCENLLAPVIKFIEVLFLEFLINGKNVLKPYETLFDEIFVSMTESAIKNDFFSKSNLDNIISTSTSKQLLKLTEDKFADFSTIKINFNDIHSSTEIQTLILMLEEFYLLKEKIASNKSRLSYFARFCTEDITLEHIIPDNLRAWLVELGEENEKILNDSRNYWFLIILLNRSLNSTAGDLPFAAKLTAYKERTNIFLGHNTFQKIKNGKDLLSNIEQIKNTRINRFRNNISLFKKQEA